MFRTIICLLVMTACMLWGCLDRAAQRRAELDHQWHEYKTEQVCMYQCNADNSKCLVKKGHAQLACSQHYADCVRECPPADPEEPRG